MTHRSHNNYPMVAAILWLVIILLLRFWLPGVFPGGDFVFVSLIVLSFFLDTLQLLVLVLACAFLMNWQVLPGLPLLAFVLVPLAAGILARALLWKPWTSAIVVTIVSVVVFYGILAVPFPAGTLELLPWVILRDTLFAAIMFAIFSFAYVPKIQRT